ncbi:MAG: DHH family phosphoesterase [Desulfovibrio sp.]|jgi:phosphoesterase RecJ-like protein|nr:DHH family phosphoesterase [Desulfovibrio sp.]
MQSIFQALEQAFKEAGRVLTAAHIAPDGDAVGSAAALAHIALHFGCETRILLDIGRGGHPVLTLPAPVVSGCAELEGFVPDLVVFADCGDAARAGAEMQPLIKSGGFPGTDGIRPLIVDIDHHAGNPEYGRINLVRPERAATAELVGLFAEYLGLPLSGGLGEAVYLGLVTDTGNFTFSNTTADCLGMAARIVAAGLDVADFTRRADNNWSLARMRLWGKLMNSVTLHAGGAVSCCLVRKEWLDAAGLGSEDLEGFASRLRCLKGVRVGLFIREEAGRKCRVSLRSMSDFDVRRPAALFGGGGHASAAGATLNVGPDEAARILLKELEAELRNQSISRGKAGQRSRRSQQIKIGEC